jgi:heme-degrading monooxygenase HmoA
VPEKAFVVARLSCVAAFLYSVPAGGEEAFEREYGPAGGWAEFFAGADGYLGTELHRGVEDVGRYLVLDRWSDEGRYRAFLTARREEYERRGRAAEALYATEDRLGAFVAVA